MPTQTFFRLSENKKTRLLNASWEEFLQVNYANASINKIIANAEISRGSFYQYFTDKKDLFDFLLDEIKDEIQHIFCISTERAKGDIFEASKIFYELFFENCYKDSDTLKKYIEIIKLNPDMGIVDFLKPWFINSSNDRHLDLDISNFKDSTPEYLENVLGMIVMTVSASIIMAIYEPDKKEFFKDGFYTCIEIMKYGCLKHTSVEQGGGQF